MLDIRLLREETDRVRQAMADRNDKADIDALLKLDDQRKSLAGELDEKRSKRKTMSQEIGKKMKAGEDVEGVKAEVRALGDEVQAGEEKMRALQEELSDLQLRLPNVPHETVPVGGEEDFRIEREWGEKPSFDFEPKPHDDLGKALDILELERAANISGSGWPCLKGQGAKLSRALINFMLDFHTEKHGMTELNVPYVVNRKSMTGTGQLPKFEDDAYRISEDDLFLIPTAEVPVTNLHAGEMLKGSDLPIYYTAHTPCFRREAGAHGKDTRGIMRVHQFDKVEMVKFVKPEDSWDEIETLCKAAEDILQALGLHYRVITLATADLGFSASKCYDIEVWAPGANKWLECSSCSNFVDFQARRAGIRFKRDEKSKPEFVHTLNASGLALPRTIITLLETFQQADGSIKIPEALQPYFGKSEITK